MSDPNFMRYSKSPSLGYFGSDHPSFFYQPPFAHRKVALHNAEEPSPQPVNSSDVQQREALPLMSNVHGTSRNHTTVLSDEGRIIQNMTMSLLQDTVGSPLNNRQGKRYPCNLCPKVFRQEMSLNVHRQTHGKQRPYNCSFCSKSFIAKHHLKTHQLSAHSGEKLFTCDVCDKKFGQGSSLVRHAKKQHNTTISCSSSSLPTPDSPPTLFEGGDESHYFLSDSVPTVSREDHRATTSALPCVVSGSELLSEWRPAGGKCHQCEVCLRFLSSGDSLRRHEKTHYTDTRFRCDLCDKSYTSPYGLRVHVDIFHKKLRQFVCDVCEKAFQTRAHLKTHRESVHAAALTYQCRNCPKMFKAKRLLERHEKSHAVIMHSCIMCPKVFAYKHDLITHVQSQHGILLPLPPPPPPSLHPQPYYQPQARPARGMKKQHKCEECGTTFCRFDSLKRHAKHMHNVGN